MSAGLWIATRDGVIRNPESGEQYRIVKGRTLGHPGHPAVAAYPENWHPLDIELDVPDADPEADGDARAEADGYREQLAAIVELLRERELVGFAGVSADHEGWLVETLRAVLDASTVSEPAEPSDEPVAAPRTARKPRAKATAPSVSDDAVH